MQNIKYVNLILTTKHIMIMSDYSKRIDVLTVCKAKKNVSFPIESMKYSSGLVHTAKQKLLIFSSSSFLSSQLCQLGKKYELKKKQSV